MQIKLFQNASENNNLNKKLTEISTLNGNFRSEVNIISPIIDIEDKNDIYAKISNYAFIEDLGRYYFINKIICYRTGIYTLELQIDVLQTYKDDILELYAVVNQDSNNKYYIANTGNYDVRKDKEIVYLENNFNPNGEMVLTGINSNTL